MQKSFFLFLCCLCTAFVSQAQLSNSAWKGTVMAPDEIPATLRFKSDVLDVVITASGSLLESMSYQLSGDTLLLKKISGGSPCDTSALGKYLWRVNGDNLTVTPVSDPCSARIAAWPKAALIRTKE